MGRVKAAEQERTGAVAHVRRSFKRNVSSLDVDMDLQEAMDQPRLFPLPGTNSVEAEGAVLEIIEEPFTKRGFKVQPPRWPIGGAQAIAIDWETGVLTGASDHRKDGAALGY